MPHPLDKIDVSIIKSLMEDGRKSFRQISRELGISTPTIKFRYQRLVNIGLIKKVIPVIDTSKLENSTIKKCNCHTEIPKIKVTEKMSVKMICEYCEADISGKPQVLKFADQERFFCCTSCKSLFKEKHKGRIDSISEKFMN